MLGIHEYERSHPLSPEFRKIRNQLTRKLLHIWHEYSDADWHWFENRVTYENARLSQALIINGRSPNNPQALEIGLTSLRWLVSLQQAPAGHFRPIGCNGFYEKGGERADFDQQPVEAQAMVSACHTAFRVTGDAT